MGSLLDLVSGIYQYPDGNTLRCYNEGLISHHSIDQGTCGCLLHWKGQKRLPLQKAYTLPLIRNYRHS